jgi:catechol 2,3-dioxygenase-like lactoylglutathione lyase family enzyme
MTETRASSPAPRLRQFVLDAEDSRELAEFYHHLTGLPYFAGDEPPADGADEGSNANFLVLTDDDGVRRLAFQRVDSMPAPTWPEGPRPQMAHLDFEVASDTELEAVRRRALDLGATVLDDRADDAAERLIVFADPAGHPFCVFIPAA